MAVCYHPSHMFNLDDNVATYGDVSHLAQLDIHYNSQSILFFGNVFLGCLLPCLRQRIGTTYATCKVYLHQRNRFLLLLAGKNFCVHFFASICICCYWFSIAEFIYLSRNSLVFLHLRFSFKFCIKFTSSTAIIINKQDNFSFLEYKT